MCKQHLVEMQREYTAIRARGAEVVAIGQGTTAQAERFCGQLGVSYPCLGDPGKESYQSFGLPRAGWREILIDPIFAGNQAVREGYKVSIRGSLLRSSDWFQLPGLAIIDRAGVLRYLHRSKHSGDLPATTDVLLALDSLSS
ncbi:MAG: redoxin domain-containing protein [Deltaproteobacteria bacterium]|nr:redoxin domain-containing protein [Deltaproteobacteria bacterium]MBI3389536.1 redoxin domain-containing protein [Deltaproteobacteria bacterium]